VIQFRFTKRSVDEKISSGKIKSIQWEIDQLSKLENLHNENQSIPFLIVCTINKNALYNPENNESEFEDKSFAWDITDIPTINFEIKGALREELLQSDKTKYLRRFMGFVKRYWHHPEREIYPKSLGSRINFQVYSLDEFKILLNDNPAYNTYIKTFLDKSQLFNSLEDDELICILNIFDIKLDTKKQNSLVDKLWQFIKSEYSNLLSPLALIPVHEQIDEIDKHDIIDVNWHFGMNTLSSIEFDLHISKTISGWSSEFDYIVSSSDTHLKELYNDKKQTNNKNHYVLNNTILQNIKDEKILNYAIKLSQFRGILRNTFWYLISSLKGVQSIEPHPKGYNTHEVDWLNRIFGKIDRQSRLKLWFDNRSNSLFVKPIDKFKSIYDFLYKRLMNKNVQSPPHIQIYGINEINSKLTIQIEECQLEEIIGILLAIDMINLGFFRIGKMKSRGFGRMQIVPTLMKSSHIKNIIEDKKYENEVNIPPLSGYQIAQCVFNIENPFSYLKEKF